jgi:hypothetical protein
LRENLEDAQAIIRSLRDKVAVLEGNTAEDTGKGKAKEDEIEGEDEGGPIRGPKRRGA